MKLKDIPTQQSIEGFYAYDVDSVAILSPGLARMYVLAKAGRDSLPDDISEDDLFQSVELEHPVARCFQQYICKWRNIVERYTGPLVQVRQAHNMMLYALCQATALSSTAYGRGGRGDSSRYLEDISSMIIELHRRLINKQRFTNIDLNYSDLGRKQWNKTDWEERAQHITRDIISFLFITANPLCSYSTNCERCIFTYINTILMVMKGGESMYGCNVHSCMEEVSEYRRNNKSTGYIPYFGIADKILSLITRDQQTAMAMIRVVSLHMVTLRRILDSGMKG